ncbi:hypothetical protein Aperf_G00000076912 [Anoplocephala perfoliata]
MIKQRLTGSKGCGSQIESIEKSHASLTSVPDDVLRSYRTLEECKLDANQIKELPSAFFRLEKLRILSVSDNELTRIPPGIGNFSSLVELDISRNEIVSLKKLQKLELRDNYLNNLPGTFGELSNLEFLDLGGNDFVSIPPSIGSLHNLLELWLDDNQMTSLPNSVLFALKRSYPDIASEIGNLHALQQIDVSENRLTSLPSTISGLTSLSDLNLTQNFLDCLPDEIGQLGNLSVLKLNRNQLVDLTPAIGKCQNLLEFYLTENYLSALPSTIGNLAKMFHFNVTKNQLSDLPPEIGKCGALQILSLRDNNLRRIPSEIGNLTQLHVLDLAGNRLDRLPVSLTACPLKALWLVQSQAQPISLQRAVDEATGEEYLTCYLLPQEVDENVCANGLPPSNVSSPGATSDQFRKELESATNGTIFPDALFPSGISSIVNLEEACDGHGEEDEATRELNSASTRVRFTAEDGAAKSANEGSQTREYPKTRHPMHLKKGLDGEYAHKTNENVPLLPPNTNDAHPGTDQNTSHNRIPQLPVCFPIRFKEFHPTNTHDSNLGSEYAGSLSSDLASPISTTSSGGIDDLLSPNASTSNTSRTRRHGNDNGGGGGVTFAEKPVEVSGPTEQEDEEQAYSSGGEEIDTITKSVAFSDEVIDNEDNANLKLIRRDTPHYTKRARINMNNEEAVLKLLKKCYDPNLVNAFVEGNTTDDTKSQTTNPLLMAAAAAATSGNGGFTGPQKVLNTANSAFSSISPQPPQQNQATSVPPSSPKTEQVTLHVTLERAPGGGLGLSIAGGVGSVPFRGLDQGIFVSRLAPGGLAETSGLKVGDKLLEVNGVSMVNVEHQVAVSALRTDATRLKLLICREVPIVTQTPLPPQAVTTDRPSTAVTQPSSHLVVDSQRAHYLSSSLLNTTSLGRTISKAPLSSALAAPTAMQLIKCTLHRDWSGLGFSIAGGRGLLGPQADASTIYISRIVEGGAADKTGKLRVGDQLYKINGIDVRNARHDQVITLLTGAGTNVELEVLRKLIGPQAANTDSSVIVGSSVVSPATSPTVNSGSTEARSLSHSISLIERPQFLRKEAGFDVYRVNLKHRPGKNLGLRICGGCDSSSLPFGGGTPGVFICRVQEGGEAQEAGLRVGDRLLSVNGRDLRRANHDEAVSALMPSGLSEESLLLEVRHDPSPPGLRELVIPCPPDEPLGLSLVSLRSTVPSPPLPSISRNSEGEAEKEGIFVNKIAPRSPIARNGQLKPGDQLLVANSEWLMSLEPQEVAEVVHPQEGKLRLTICDGIDVSKLVSSTRQPTFSNLSCLIIDCDSKASERVRPFTD